MNCERCIGVLAVRPAGGLMCPRCGAVHFAPVKKPLNPVAVVLEGAEQEWDVPVDGRPVKAKVEKANLGTALKKAVQEKAKRRNLVPRGTSKKKGGSK